MELQKAAAEIGALKNELKMQENYYENELQRQREQINQMIDPESSESQKRITDKENYQKAVNQCLILRKRLSESNIEKEELDRRISILNQELSLQ